MIPRYIRVLLKKYPRIASGRKNYRLHQMRIEETIKLIKKYFNIKN